MSFKLSKYDREELYDIATFLACGGEIKGWKKFTSTYRRLRAFYNKRLGVVVKSPNCILDEDTPRAVRVPTIELGENWVAQPIVKKVRLRKACNILRKRMARAYRNGVFPDLHCQNVGWYKGQPVMFDW